MDSVRKSLLPNGIRVVTEFIPETLSTAVGIWVENGSRHEHPSHNGVSHFIEHLLFKGTSRRSAQQIAAEIDSVGGVLNAFTGKEYTCYHARVLGDDLSLALDLLADIFLDSQFEPSHVERERQVVLQEISQAEDTPDDFIHDLFNLKYWEGHPLALPIFGSAETVNGIDRTVMLSFMAERYRAERVVIAAAGRVDHDWFLERCARLFEPVRRNGTALPLTPPVNRPRIIHHEKSLEQVHLCIGGPALSQVDPLRYAAYVLNTALGGGMSSRLFQKVREERGHVYTIYSALSSFLDCGYFTIYAGTNREWVDEVVSVTLHELADIARNGLRPDELERARNQLRGNMLLALESTESRMNRLARNELCFGRQIPISEITESLNRVTNDQIVELASSFFRADQMAMVVLGDLKGRELGPEIWEPLAR